MKLQNLLYATMVACAFSACSNDDDPNIPDPVQELDATLTTAFAPVGNSGSSLKSTTKAPDDAFGTVSKIGLAVFDNGAMGSAMTPGTLLSYVEKTNESDTTACIAAKSGDVKVLVVANPTTNMFQGVSTLDGFLDKISSEAIDTNNLLMSSKVYELTLKPGRNVMVKDLTNSVFKSNTTQDQIVGSENIKVYRNVARVEVPSITVNPREGFGKGKGATFTLSKVFVANVRPSVRVAGKKDVTGLFGAATAWSSVVNTESTLTAGKTTETDDAYSEAIAKEIVYANTDVNGKKETIAGAQFFVYDNASNGVIATPKDNATLLVLKGTYSYTTDAGTTATSENAYWTVAINNSTPVGGGDKDFPAHCGVLRNVKYVMNVTITGPGSGTIDPESNASTLTSNIEVVSWGEVVLDPSID